MSHVTRVGFAAVKGTRHLARDQITLDDLGAVGDRALCLVDERDRVLKTVQHPRLVSVVVDDDGCVPTQETVTADYWGRPVEVTLCSPPETPWWDAVRQVAGPGVRVGRPRRTDVIWGRPVSIVTTGSIRAVEEALGVGIDPARFRPTLVVATEEPWLEDGWAGRRLHIGDAVVSVAEPIARCAVIDLDPVTGVRDSRLLHHLGGIRASREGPLFGVDADVLVRGIVRPGDEVGVGGES